MTSSKSAKVKIRSPEIVLRDGQPAAVILDIEEYQEMLERLEDLDDLETLKEMREKPLNFRRLDDLLEEYHPSVRGLPRKGSGAGFEEAPTGDLSSYRPSHPCSGLGPEASRVSQARRLGE